MATISRTIEVDAASTTVAATWDRFVKWAHNGPSRLACDELTCVDAVRAGLVGFQPSSSGGTVVTFQMESGPGRPSGDVLSRHLGHDLVVFKDYVERVGNLSGRLTTSEKQAAAGSEARAQHRPDRERLSGRDEAVAYTEHFPT